MTTQTTAQAPISTTELLSMLNVAIIRSEDILEDSQQEHSRVEIEMNHEAHIQHWA